MIAFLHAIPHAFGAERGEHATLVVDEVDKAGKAKVSLLQLYKRS